LGLFQPDVNVVWDLAPHDISILYHLIDERPVSVCATGISHLNNGIENIAYVTLNFQSNMIAHFSCSWSSPVKIRKILVGGDKKMVLFDDNEITEKVKVLEETLKEKEKDNLRLLVENINYKTQEENYKEQIKDLQNKIDKIANKAIDRPTITNNTINNNKFLVNVFPSQTEIENKIESKFNDKYLHDGIKGVAQFVFDHIVKLEDGSIAYICFDISRQIFKYKDENGVEIKDPKAFKLKKMIKPGLLKQSQTLLDYFRDECEYMEKRKAQGLEIDNKEYKIMNTLREKAFEVGCEILSIEDTNNFNNELSNLTCV
jgi:hypothetical protein